MISITGIPKSGNHALKKALLLLGVNADVTHTLYKNKPAGDAKWICIVRHPRNILISWLRVNNREITLQNIINALYYPLFGPTFLQWHLSLEGWMGDAHTRIVRYEHLVESPTTFREIAEFVGVPYIDGAWEKLPGGTITWEETYADWREHWSNDVEIAWEAAGGYVMEKIAL